MESARVTYKSYCFSSYYSFISFENYVNVVFGKKFKIIELKSLFYIQKRLNWTCNEQENEILLTPNINKMHSDWCSILHCGMFFCFCVAQMSFVSFSFRLLYYTDKSNFNVLQTKTKIVLLFKKKRKHCCAANLAKSRLKTYSFVWKTYFYFIKFNFFSFFVVVRSVSICLHCFFHLPKKTKATKINDKYFKFIYQMWTYTE